MRLPVACLVMSVALMGQGYDKTTWGMTREQVQARYQDGKFRPNAAEGGFFMDRDVAGVPCEIKFQFRGPKSGLSLVSVSPATDDLEIGQHEGQLTYAGRSGVLIRALENKYGPGLTRDQVRIWELKGTVIRMYSIRATAAFSYFEIRYSPKKQDSSGL